MRNKLPMNKLNTWMYWMFNKSNTGFCIIIYINMSLGAAKKNFINIFYILMVFTYNKLKLYPFL